MMKLYLAKRSILASLLIVGLAGSQVSAVELVSQETINEQKKLTKIYRLKNQIPVIYRQVPDSPILEFGVYFKFGMRDMPSDRKYDSQALFATMPRAAAGYPKQEIFRITEKYALELGCSSGIEVSYCRLGTLNDYWLEALPVLAAIIKSPSLAASDLELVKQNELSNVKDQIEDPGSAANDVANKVFYGEGHPYFINFDAALKQIPKISTTGLKTLHKQVLNAARLTIVVAGSLPEKEVIEHLNNHFGRITSSDFKETPVAPPKFNKRNYFAMEDRNIATAYMKFKFNAPGITDKDAVATQLFFRVFDEELGEEIRTRRSLSYSPYAMVVQYSAGIGFISISTSKPKETLEALAEVIRKMKKMEYTRAELEEHKRIYATSYYLTQEDHKSLVSALASSYLYHQQTDRLYDFPLLLEQVTPKDVSRLAKALLDDIRVGVVYDDAKFDEKWVKSFSKAYRAK